MRRRSLSARAPQRAPAWPFASYRLRWPSAFLHVRPRVYPPAPGIAKRATGGPLRLASAQHDPGYWPHHAGFHHVAGNDKATVKEPRFFIVQFRSPQAGPPWPLRSTQPASHLPPFKPTGPADLMWWSPSRRKFHQRCTPAPWPLPKSGRTTRLPTAAICSTMDCDVSTTTSGSPRHVHDLRRMDGRTQTATGTGIAA